MASPVTHLKQSPGSQMRLSNRVLAQHAPGAACHPYSTKDKNKRQNSPPNPFILLFSFSTYHYLIAHDLHFFYFHLTYLLHQKMSSLKTKFALCFHLNPSSIRSNVQCCRRSPGAVKAPRREAAGQATPATYWEAGVTLPGPHQGHPELRRAGALGLHLK